MNSAPLFIFGCGGQGRSVAEAARFVGHKEINFIDSNMKMGEKVLGYNVQNTLPKQIPGGASGFPASGNISKRISQLEIIMRSKLSLATIIAFNASIMKYSEIHDGVFIGHLSYIGPCTQIKVGAHINTGAIVEHDTSIGPFCHISVGAVVSGYCKIGSRCFVGAGATIKDNITLHDDIFVGAGATVVHDLVEAGTYVGTPARKL